MKIRETLYRKLFPKSVERAEKIAEYVERKGERKEQLRVDAEKTTNRILMTISVEEYAKLNGGNLTDYEAFLVQATSEVWFEGQGGVEIAQKDALSRLISELESKGLDVAVNVRYQNNRTGWGTMLNPTTYEVTVYGTGLRLKKKS